ncbi:MAG TPA: ABC transporter substrate-binding protein, partial [Caldilineaceae bacterium]|nr:ABC transporter substrate-binding protein [Caldilineaceae bacterium]
MSNQAAQGETAAAALVEEKGADSAFPITVTHERGEVTFDKPATRVVIFSEEFIELAIALDIAPVGVGLWRNAPTRETFTSLPYLDEPIPGEPRYLDGEQPNLEAILTLQPDLILQHDYEGGNGDELYASFSQIAPTLAYSGGKVGAWKQAIRGLGQATGRSEQAEQVIARYDARVAELQQAMEPVVAMAPEVTVLLSWVDGAGVFDERFSIGGLMYMLGFRLTTPLGEAMDPSGYVDISAETVAEISADTVMVLRFDSDQQHPIDPLLNTLDIPVLHTEIYPGMGYTGPYTELI